ncbi:hypothetical protein ACFQ60_47120 [Streptomyces zhihengii]|uniref:Uncharacterized protein n=1 Tax=Streptomyces zhihengii TaxID=1818004 RepID=A0ABS2V5K8_9ACTN|nr:hypothetical protein [Streptomyces zhihengii]MBM9624432.1 hypothetical protein [Streptomyces zhihengii]
MLARRKVALERAAQRMAEQRREAQEAEAQRLRREKAFDELVADFELVVEGEAAVVAEVEREVERVRERGRVRIDAARVAAAGIVLAMGEAGETVVGCGRRLGVGVERVKELRRLGREHLAAQEEVGFESGTVAGRSGGGRQGPVEGGVGARGGDASLVASVPPSSVIRAAVPGAVSSGVPPRPAVPGGADGARAVVQR